MMNFDKQKINTDKITLRKKDVQTSSRLGKTACLFSVVIYVLLFIYLSAKTGSGMAITVILPVPIFAWFYGRNIGVFVGAATLPANFIMALITGMPWWEKIFSRGAGVFGTIGCILMGLVVGYMRDLTRKTNLEIANRKRTEEKIRKHQDQMNEQAHELQKKNQKLKDEIVKTEQMAIEINKTKEQLESFVNISLDPIALADEKGNITNPNKAFLDMLGYTREEVLGKPVYHFVIKEEGVFESVTGESIEIKEDYFNRSKEEMDRFLKTGRISNREIYFQRKDNKVVPVNQSIVKLKNKKDEGSALFSLIHDITE